MKPIYELIKIYHEEILSVINGESMSPKLYEDLYIHYIENGKIDLKHCHDIKNLILGLLYIDLQQYWDTIHNKTY